jgi:hypothetical protein
VSSYQRDRKKTESFQQGKNKSRHSSGISEDPWENFHKGAERVFREVFAEVEVLFQEDKQREKLTPFLSEWSSMKQYEKCNARNHDPFVRKFQEIFDKIRALR